MSRARSSRRRYSLVALLSLGFMVLGIVCVGWALMGIRAQSVTPIVPVQAKPKGVGAVPSGSLTPSAPPALEVLYPRNPRVGETLGSLSIPALKMTLPVIQGTGTKELQRGVGHMTNTALPGEKDNCVISGHRDTVFSELGRLKVRDRLIVQTSAGAFTYQITRIRIVHKDDRTVVVPADHAVLTVSTCYPFHYVGSAPDRYVLIADLVASQ